MGAFVIFGDSTCDLEKTVRDQYGIGYVPMRYIIDDTEYIASLEWESHSAKEFYDLLRSGKRAFTTQVPKDEFEKAFRAPLESGLDVLYIACSSALSGSINTARVVAQELQQQFPHNRVYCVDALISSLGQGHLLIEAAKKRSAGMDAAATAAYIESIRLHVHQFATVESLEYLRRAGRVKASSAFFGNLFGIKPLIISDRKGQNYAFKKVKGTAAAITALAQLTADAADGNHDTLYIVHADNLPGAERLRDAVLQLAPFKEVVLGTIGPIVGASVGPGTIGAYCYGKEVTIEGNE